MIYTLYIVILLIVLTVHEYGHLASAQLLGIRTARLQIGLGPSIWTGYTGRTKYAVAAGVPPPPEDIPIEFVSVWQSDEQPMTIVAWRYHEPCLHRFRRIRADRGRPHAATPWTTPPPKSICQSGKVRSLEGPEATVATMAWAFAPIPLAAYVSLPESPHSDVPHCFNTTSWLTKTAITATGVAANAALFIGIMLTLPFVNNPVQAHYDSVTPAHLRPHEQPYHKRVSDTTLNYYRGFESATRNILATEAPEESPTQFQDPRPICGPICAGEITTTAVKLAGFYGWLAVLAIFTIFAAFVNILPLPPLDGWKLVLNTAQALRRKPFNPATTLAIEIAAVAVIGLIITATLFLDLHHHLK